jgi:hypothetical protein
VNQTGVLIYSMSPFAFTGFGLREILPGLSR